MFQSRLTFSAGALLLANLAPLAGVLFFDWSVSSVIILYWFENVVLGVVNVARMIAFSPEQTSMAAVMGGDGRTAVAASAAGRRLDSAAMIHGVKLFLIPFFMFHYFFFCAGHGVFVFSLFPDENGWFPESNGLGMFDSLGRAIEIFSTPLAFAAVVLALSHIVSFFVNYIGGGEYRRLDLRRLMTMPYGRIVVLHLTIIFGGFATMLLGEPIWLLAVFVLLKIGVDLKLHFREHSKLAAQDRDETALEPATAGADQR